VERFAWCGQGGKDVWCRAGDERRTGLGELHRLGVPCSGAGQSALFVTGVGRPWARQAFGFGSLKIAILGYRARCRHTCWHCFRHGFVKHGVIASGAICLDCVFRHPFTRIVASERYAACMRRHTRGDPQRQVVIWLNLASRRRIRG